MFGELVFDFFGDEIVQVETANDSLIVAELKDVNYTYHGQDWSEVLIKYLKEYGIEAKVKFADGHWINIERL